MKIYLVIIFTINLITITQCGFLEGIYGAVKNTTNTIKQDITGVVRYGKNAVFGDNTIADQKNFTKKDPPSISLVDKISLKIHEVATNVREHFRSAIAIFDKDENGNGPLQRMLERMKNHVIHVKGLLFKNNTTHNENIHKEFPPKRDTALLCQKLKNYIFRNKSSSDTGIRKTLNSLKEILDKILHNITKDNNENDNKETDGTGLIDIRSDLDNLAGNLQDNVDNLNNNIEAAYDKVDNDVNEIQENVGKSINQFEQNSKNFINNQRNNLQNSYENLNTNAEIFTNGVNKSYNEIQTRVINDIDDTKSFLSNGYNAVDANEKP